MLKGKTLEHGELIFCDWEECGFSLSLVLETIDCQTCQINYFLTCQFKMLPAFSTGKEILTKKIMRALYFQMNCQAQE